MGKYYFESGDTEYIAANDNTTVIGTGAANEKIILNAGVENVIADSTIERVDFIGEIADFQFRQGFGSNIDVLDGADNPVVSLASVDGKEFGFDDGIVELEYTDGTVSVGGTDITDTAATVVPVVIDDSDASEVDGGDTGTVDLYPSAEEQLMLEILNSERAAPDEYASRYGIDLNEGLVEGTISSDPKQPLAFNTALAEAARAHSLWMLENDIFSHTGSGGSDPGDRIEAEGYEAYGWGENLAWLGTWPSVPDTAESTGRLEENLFVDEGYPERGHRTNMLNEEWTEVGIGIETGIFTYSGQDYNAVMATQDFAIPSTRGNFLVGVAFMDDDADMFYDVDEGLPDVQVSVTDQDSGEILNVSTWDSGGYQAALEDGVYDVNFSWEDQTFSTEITMSGINEKVDWVLTA